MPDAFPTLDRDPVDGDSASSELWPFLADLADELPGSWVLVGGKMVLLHGLEHDQLSRRETVDADALVDVRLLPHGTERLAAALQRRELEIEGMNPDGVGHRFSGGGSPSTCLPPTT